MFTTRLQSLAEVQSCTTEYFEGTVLIVLFFYFSKKKKIFREHSAATTFIVCERVCVCVSVYALVHMYRE